MPTWIKLEIHPDPRYLLPDPVETLAAAKTLLELGCNRAQGFLLSRPLDSAAMESLLLAKRVIPVTAAIADAAGFSSRR